MTKETDKEFFKEEINKLCKCFTELEKYYPELGKDVDHPKINFTSFREMEAELKILKKFLLGKAHDIHPPEGMEQLESEVKALGYSPEKGVSVWFKNRLKDKKKITYESRKRFRPSSKNEGEIACVRKFCENKGQCLKDSQIKPNEEEDSPIDVVVEEDGRKTYFQVTYILRKKEGALSAWGGCSGEVETPEEIGKEIKEVIKEKELKLGGEKDIILLLVAFFPIPAEHLEQAVAKLLSYSPFKEIYIATLERNFPIRTRPADEEP